MTPRRRRASDRNLARTGDPPSQPSEESLPRRARPTRIEMPAVLVADLLGVNRNTAGVWCRLAGPTWASTPTCAQATPENGVVIPLRCGKLAFA
jgi:hypothetical protein